MRTATAVAEAGATVLRGGAFKPRTSPYSFQGLGMDGVRFLTAILRAAICLRPARPLLLAAAAAAAGQPVVLKGSG